MITKLRQVIGVSTELVIGWRCHVGSRKVCYSSKHGVIHKAFKHVLHLYVVVTLYLSSCCTKRTPVVQELEAPFQESVSLPFKGVVVWLHSKYQTANVHQWKEIQSPHLSLEVDL